MWDKRENAMPRGHLEQAIEYATTSGNSSIASRNRNYSSASMVRENSRCRNNFDWSWTRRSGSSGSFEQASQRHWRTTVTGAWKKNKVHICWWAAITAGEVGLAVGYATGWGN